MVSTMTKNLIEALENAIHETILASVHDAIQGAMEEVKDNGSLADLVEQTVNDFDFDHYIKKALENYDLSDCVSEVASSVMEDIKQDHICKVVSEVADDVIVDAVEEFIHSDKFFNMLNAPITRMKTIAVNQIIEDFDFLTNLAEHVAMILDDHRPKPWYRRTWKYIQKLFSKETRIPSCRFLTDS